MSHRTRANPAARLGRLTLFAQCSHDQLEEIDRLCTPIIVPAGRVLCTQGDIARECFVVVDGSALVRIDGCNISMIDRGELIGELALLAPGGRRTATVTADTEMTLVVFSRQEFSTIMSSYPRLTHTMLREATRRLLQNADVAAGHANTG